MLCFLVLHCGESKYSNKILLNVEAKGTYIRVSYKIFVFGGWGNPGSHKTKTKCSKLSIL